MEAADLWCSLDYGKEEVKPGNFGSQRKVSKERQKVLKENPQSLSFVAGDGQTESEETEEEQTEEEEGEVPFRERRMQAWMDKLQEDLGVKIIDEVATEEEDASWFAGRRWFHPKEEQHSELRIQSFDFSEFANAEGFNCKRGCHGPGTRHQCSNGPHKLNTRCNIYWTYRLIDR